MSALLKEIKRLRLQTLARALTERDGLLVGLGESSSTDLANLELKDPDLEIVPGVPCSSAEKWVAAKAACAHESAHVLFSDRRVWEEACNSGLFLQHILNVLEDARAERAMANAYPGTLFWFRFANEYVYKNRRDWGEGAQAFLLGLCSYAVVGKIPPAVPPEIRGLIEKCKPLVDRARLAPDTRGAFACAREIHDLVAGRFPPPPLSPLPAVGTGNPREAPQGPLDPRPAPRRKRQPVPKERDENGPDKNPGGKPDKDTAGPEDEPAGGERGGSAGKPVGDGPDEPDGDSGAGEPGEKNDGADRAQANGGNPPPGPGDDSEDRPDEPGGETGCAGPGGKDEPEDGPEPGNGRSNDGPGEDDDGPDSGPDGGEPEGEFNPDDEEEDDRSADGDDAGDELEDDPESDDEPGDEPDEDAGWPGGDGEEDFGLDFSSLVKEAEEELAGIESAAARQEKEAARNAAPAEPDWEKVEAGLSKDLHAGCRFEWRDLPPAPQDYQKLVQARRGLVRRLVEEIRRALEFRAAVPRRNLKKGRLDAGSLWKLRVPDPRVFSRRETPGDVPAVAIFLLVDCSSSMWWSVRSGGGRVQKMELARAAACVLHEACGALGVPHTVAGFNSFYPETWFYRAVGWGDRDGTKIPSLEPGWANRDGYAVRVVAEELELRPEPRKVLVVLSDGLPNDDADDRYRVRSGGLPDTARAVRELERKGIGVVGLFFGDEEHVSWARQIYNRFIFVQDVGRLPVILGRVLKEAVTGGA